MASRARQLSITCSLLAGILLLFVSEWSFAQGQKKGDASLRVEFQSIRTGTYQAEVFAVDYWKTESHIALLSGDYALSDRWSVYAVLPYVQKRFIPRGPDFFGTGPGDPHNPNHDYWIDFVPPDKRFIDDGDYHGGLQDLSFGVTYRAVDGLAWTVSPYIGYAFPTTNYPFFGKAAIGANLWNIPVGVDVGFVPYFSDWYFRGNLAYVFSEKPLGVKVDFWLAHLSAGYWFKPNFSMNISLSSKYLVDGLRLDFDFSDNPFIYPVGYDTIEWWMHDRLLRHRLLTLGVGFDYFVNDRYQVSGSYLIDNLWAEQTTEVDYALSLSLTRFFSGE